MREDYKQKYNTKNIIKIVLIILYQILVIMALVLTMVIVLQRVTNSNKSIGGYKIFRVITGSMEPEYEVGEVVISKEVNPKDIQVGDDIVYFGKTGEYAGKIIMHNVVGIETDEDGELIFHAKGLQSNTVEDPQISEEQIYGVVKYKSSVLTILYDSATNIYSVFFIIIVLVLNVFIAFNTPKKTKKHKVKRIANINNDTEEAFYDEETDEEEYDEEEIEEIDDISDNEIHMEEGKEDNQEDMEKSIHEQKIYEQMKQMLNDDKKTNGTKTTHTKTSIKNNTNTKTSTKTSTKTNTKTRTSSKKNANTNAQEKKGENRKNK